MNILIFANYDEGLYLFRKELLMELRKQNHKVIVSVPRGIYSDDILKIVDEMIPTTIDRRGINPVKDLMLILKYIKIIMKFRPDCILTYTIKPNIYGGILAKVFHIPRLINITGLGTSFEKNGILRKILIILYKLSLYGAAGVFFQNQANKKELEDFGIHSSKFTSIIIPGSGVNLQQHKYKTYPLQGDTIKFLFIARIMRDKGIYELVSAIQYLKERYNNLEFHVVGMCEDGYKEKVKKWMDDGLIIYHGQQQDVDYFLKQCHCLIHPSYHEGMSNVCLEAAASGRPILASNIFGCKETFDEGITGISFERKDVNSLVKAIECFIDISYDEKRKMGLLGRKKIEKEFNRELITNAYINRIKLLEDKNNVI